MSSKLDAVINPHWALLILNEIAFLLNALLPPLDP